MRYTCNKELVLSIVILHYNDFNLTKKYVDELDKQNWLGINHHIIIVDNASPDGSGKELQKYFNNIGKVDVILSKENLGFAKGNNLGIQKAKKEYNSDLIIVSNNDIYIPNNMFMQELSMLYQREKFDVMGPDIYTTRRKFHQSPLRQNFLSIGDIDSLIEKNCRLIKILKIVDKLKIYNLLSWIKSKIKGAPSDSPTYKEKQEGVVLHGAFFVLSKSYLAAYPDGLYPHTFLYMEEDILNYRIHKKKLKSLYIPDLKVDHFEGFSSIKKNNNNRCKKYIFELEQTNKACIIMKKYLEGDIK